VQISTRSKDVKPVAEDSDKTGASKLVGTAVARALLDKGIKAVVFDRNGYLYHGRIQALAEAARAAGLEF
jgi:large subunit ribosomal protein L18